MNVCSRLPCDSVSLSSFQKNETIIDIGDNILALAFHKDTCIFIFPDIEGFVWVSILKQIKQLFIINLQERAVDSVADICFGLNWLQAHE